MKNIDKIDKEKSGFDKLEYIHNTFITKNILAKFTGKINARRGELPLYFNI